MLVRFIVIILISVVQIACSSSVELPERRLPEKLTIRQMSNIGPERNEQAYYFCGNGLTQRWACKEATVKTRQVKANQVKTGSKKVKTDNRKVKTSEKKAEQPRRPQKALNGKTLSALIQRKVKQRAREISQANRNISREGHDKRRLTTPLGNNSTNSENMASKNMASKNTASKNTASKNTASKNTASKNMASENTAVSSTFSAHKDSINIFRKERGDLTPLAQVVFEKGSFELNVDARQKIESILWDDEISDQQYIVLGYTLALSGQEQLNALSERRADSVKQYLIAKGINGNTIDIKEKEKLFVTSKTAAQG